jgi:hypothetical protein
MWHDDNDRHTWEQRASRTKEHTENVHDHVWLYANDARQHVRTAHATRANDARDTR